MKPYYEDSESGIVIYNADCREVLPTLSPVDLVLTDPPYNEVNRESGGLRNLDRGEADSTPFEVWPMATELARIAEGSIYVWCASEQVSQLRGAFVGAGLSTRIGVWHKSNPSPMNGESLWLSAVELCVFARKSKAYFSRHCAAPVWKGPTEPRDDHPTAKPLWLFRELISASCAAGGTVCDPYMGSGTTLLAAKLSGHRAIGIEIEERYCEIAANRLAQGVLFGVCT